MMMTPFDESSINMRSSSFLLPLVPSEKSFGLDSTYLALPEPLRCHTYRFANDGDSGSNISAAVLLAEVVLSFGVPFVALISPAALPFVSGGVSVDWVAGFLRLGIGEVAESLICAAVMSKSIIGLSIAVSLSLS